MRTNKNTEIDEMVKQAKEVVEGHDPCDHDFWFNLGLLAKKAPKDAIDCALIVLDDARDDDVQYILQHLQSVHSPLRKMLTTQLMSRADATVKRFFKVAMDLTSMVHEANDTRQIVELLTIRNKILTVKLQKANAQIKQLEKGKK